MKVIFKRTFLLLSLLFSCVFLIFAGDGQIDIAILPYSISQSGSYIVTCDLTLSTLDTNGITITADNVTIDLNGHTLVGPGKSAGSSGSGIFVSGGRCNITIRNGTVRDWRYSGVNAVSAFNSKLEDLHCYNNGFSGIYSGSYNIINCNTCYGNGNAGIKAINANNITANICGENGSDGIWTQWGSTIIGNTCYGNEDNGIYATASSTIRENTCQYNTDDGIYVLSSNNVVENTCVHNGYDVGDGAGIYAQHSNNRIIGNLCVGNDRGLDLNNDGNIVSDNVLRENTTPIEAEAGNQLDILISELPYAISYPGMYHLSGSLSLTTTNTPGITISADNVTFDLEGQALIGPGKTSGASGSGILISGARNNIVVRNGTIRDWRGNGIEANAVSNSQFESLKCYSNGANGIYAGPNSYSIFTNNVCKDNNSSGIYAGNSNIYGNVCIENGGDGISAYNGCTVSGNTSRSNGDDGITAYSSCMVKDNNCSSNTGDGIEVSSNCFVTNNACSTNGAGTGNGAGVHTTGSDNSIEHNLVVDNDRGIQCNPTTGSYIASNRASGNTTNYDIVAGNTQGTGDLANVSF